MSPGDEEYTVSNIKANRRWPGIYTITFSDDKTIVCPDECVVRWSLRTDVVLTSAQFCELKNEAECKLATLAAVRILTASAKSSRTLMLALRKRKFSPAAAQYAVKRMVELGYIDDVAYGRQLITQLQKAGKKGRLGIIAELQRRGISTKIIEQIYQDQDDQDERNKALTLANRKLASYSGLPQHICQRRLAAFLARRGFDYPVIRWCLAELNLSNDDLV